VKNRVPVNAQCLDTDGIAIDVLLHVVDGRLDELELYKVDGSPMLSAPQPEDLSTY
jgi:hypothetical protein